MFPALLSDLCKLGGAYNNEVIVMERKYGESTLDMPPQWSPDALRPLMGKAQLLIRPRYSILEKAKELKVSKVTAFIKLAIFPP